MCYERAQLQQMPWMLDCRVGRTGKRRIFVRYLRAYTALWDEMVKSGRAVVKVGLHELVMPAQVKMKYMNAAARVHPDKARFVVFFLVSVFLLFFASPFFFFRVK